MLELMTDHLDDFTLLRHAANDLTASERDAVSAHLDGCAGCLSRMAEMSVLDEEIRQAALDGAFAPADELALPADDPFRSRPRRRTMERRRPEDPAKFAADALRAAEEGAEFRQQVRAAGQSLPDLLAEVSFDEPAMRYGVLYALQDAGREIASGPVGALRLAETVLKRLRGERLSDGDAEILVPALLIKGQAHLLAGQACNWLSQFEQGKTHLRLSYRCFGNAGGDEVGLAMVEFIEAQRRFLVSEGGEALVLARRAKASFQALGLEDYAARADLAVGGALVELDRCEEALPLVRNALVVFERREIWTNYVGALNNLGACLQKLGRLNEARREYARALRRFSKDRDISFLGGIRHGLADVLFADKKFKEAAASFFQASRLYDEQGRTGKCLSAQLFEIESWARSGDVSRALHRLDIFETRIERLGMLDPTVTRQIQEALSGANPDLERLSRLRSEAQQFVETHLATA
jgi:tetratricopeptide (TPR) repeat protein